ncbi:hypothetical protein [Pseudoflavitalea rhizosphaerae]|uniref:hypothetical protein n=1 Tax=Pseudoflavitalea rhizosphaerae TaxID=1884793 RepID=UPI000F8DE571|nr:hypothetical protein [Pseudoflavitalea rhizosphaerae]
MDTTNNIEKESIELVLEEFGEDQKLLQKTIDDLVTAINGLTDRVKQIEGKLENPQGVTVAADTRPIQEIVKKGLIDARLIVAGQPKNIIRKFQILLFPERDAKLFYKVVFGRWFLFLVIMFFIAHFYKFTVHWNEAQKVIELRQLENDRTNVAWNYLYEHQGKQGKKLMDSIYHKIHQ